MNSSNIGKSHFAPDHAEGMVSVTKGNSRQASKMTNGERDTGNPMLDLIPEIDMF